jgi:tRNA uridine 5-carbamoylmethylation protein Kti12
METKVINLVGAPGAGKSTIASQLFSRMKWEGYDVELVSEYAKELVWEERMETMKNEVYLFGKQHQRLFRLKNKVQYIITDRPLILSQFYNSKYGDSSQEFKNIVLHEVRKYNNFNIFLHRSKPYIIKGRNQTEEESNEFSKEILSMMKDLGENVIEVVATEELVEDLLKIIK